MRRIVSIGLAAVVLSGAVVGWSGSASAATTSEEVQSVLAALGVSTEDPTLLAELSSGLDEATDLGIVDDAVLTQLRTRTEDATADGEQLRLRIEEHLRLQLSDWATVGPEWRDAAGASVEQLRACLDADEDPAVCAEQNLIRVQVQHAVLLEERFQQRLDQLESLPAAERARAELALRTSLELSVREMERIAGQMTDELLAQVGIDPALIDGLATRLRDAGSTSGGSSSTAPGSTAPGSTAPGSTTPGGSSPSGGAPSGSSPATSAPGAQGGATGQSSSNGAPGSTNGRGQ